MKIVSLKESFGQKTISNRDKLYETSFNNESINKRRITGVSGISFGLYQTEGSRVVMAYLSTLSTETKISPSKIVQEIKKIYNIKVNRTTVIYIARKMGFTTLSKKEARQTEVSRIIKEYLLSLPKGTVISLTQVAKELSEKYPELEFLTGSISQIARSLNIATLSKQEANQTKNSKRIKQHLSTLPEDTVVASAKVAREIAKEYPDAEICPFSVLQIAQREGFKTLGRMESLQTPRSIVVEQHLSTFSRGSFIFPTETASKLSEKYPELKIGSSSVASVAVRMGFQVPHRIFTPWRLKNRVGMFLAEKGGYSSIAGEKIKSPFDIAVAKEEELILSPKKLLLERLSKVLPQLQKEGNLEFSILCDRFGLNGRIPKEVEELAAIYHRSTAEIEDIINKQLEQLKNGLKT